MPPRQETQVSIKTSADASAARAYRTPRGVEKTLTFRSSVGGRGARVNAAADWILVREHGVPVAEVFFTSYELAAPGRKRRPLTFLFNGGPGAASAFLHMGSAGPQRISFGADGRPLPPPVQVVENAESWLRFSDLVFVDPVGTGLSRTVAESRLEQQALEVDDDKREKRTKDLPDAKKGFFKIKRDIDVLCEFVSAFLSRSGRWDSPIYVAGESYGGFRVGKLMRALPDRGVGLCGAIMVSPAIDFLALVGSDYDFLSWIGTVPTMALAAGYHKKSRGRFASLSHDRLAAAAEAFAYDELAPLLLRGDSAPAQARTRAYQSLADLIGLPLDLVVRHAGRVPIDLFARELLRDRNLLCGLYDAAVTGVNVFPDRVAEDANPDPTLAGITPAYTAGVNTVLRGTLGLSTDREYHLMNHDAWKQWGDDRGGGYWQRQLECADDMRYGMGASPEMKLLIAHGWFDLVTTYTSSRQSVDALRLPESLRRNITLVNYHGGHMFYSWEASRKASTRDIARMYAD